MIAALLLALAAPAAGPPPPADALTARVHTEDAERFAKLFDETGGKPSAAQLRQGYLDPGSYGVAVFTPGRIDSADHLAKEVAAHPQRYRDAITRCLPVVKQADAELRAIYLALHGLFPTRALPQIYVVFGAGNSGGTAGPGAQVLGLEVLCADSPTPDALRETLRMFFAHETTHTWQHDVDGKSAHPLLDMVLIEGGADYVASLVLGRAPSLAREAWAPPREAELWKQFEADLAATRDFDPAKSKKGDPRRAVMERWIGNYGHAPAGWPFEMGYWIGLRIWQRYVDAAPDKHAALKQVLNWRDAEAVLARGRYRGR